MSTVHLRRALAPAVVLAVVAVLVSGCGLLPQPSPEQPDPPAAGTCLAARDGAVIDRTSVVPCTEPHLFDVVGTVTWDGMDAAIADRDAESVYNTIDNGRNAEFDSAMLDACDELNRELLGIEGVSVNGVDAASMDLTVMGPYTDFSLNDLEAFLAGDYSTICVVRWTDFDDAERTVAYPEGIGFADYTSPEFPSDLHVCAVGGETGNTFLDCTEPHETQQLLGFAGIDTVGAEWIATVNPVDFTAPDYTVPDAVCADLVAQAFPELTGPWVVWSNIFSGTSGWDGFDGTVDPDAGYYFSCDLNTPDSTMFLVGDAFSGTSTTQPR